jgi:hypothetical protein
MKVLTNWVSPQASTVTYPLFKDLLEAVEVIVGDITGLVGCKL